MNQEKRTSKQANETVQALEGGASAFRPDQRQVHELGKLIRESASLNLPQRNGSLSETISAHLKSLEGDAVSIASQPDHSTNAKTGKRYWAVRWTVAASVLVAVGSWAYWEGLLNPSEVDRGPSESVVLASRGDDRVPMVSSASESGADSGGQAINGQVVPREIDSDLSESVVLVKNEDGKTPMVSLKPAPESGPKDAGGQVFNGLVDSYGRLQPGYLLEGKQLSGQQSPSTGLVRHLPASERTLGIHTIAGLPVGSDPDALFFRGTDLAVNVPNGGTVLMGGIKREAFGTETLVRSEKSDGSVRYRWFDTGVPMFEGRFQESRQNSEAYESITENRFVEAIGGNAISTFSIDVDTASYANMRRFLRSGQLPPPNAIRIEEMVNYFDYDYPQPNKDQPFSVNMELADCPWNSKSKLLRVGLKGKEIHRDERPPTNVVFLLDVSGSMNEQAKLPLLKRGFKMMVDRLSKTDRVSIVTYAGNAGVVLEPTSGDQKKSIHEAIESLTPGGSTHGSAGIELAYQLAQKNFIHNGVNKVVLATDGDLNVGITGDDALVDLITQKASENVFLTVLGFGTGNLKDSKMEKLADHGNGLYAYIDTIREAHKVLVEEMSGSLVTIAKDVKIQIEFNPAEVTSYRLIGYENRMLATQDFDDDQKDAGEIGAGHTVTALYEVMTRDNNSDATETTATKQVLKYQKQAETNNSEAVASQLSKAAESGELMTLALRYKQPDESSSKRIEYTLPNVSTSFSTASEDFRFAASVAGTGMLLRRSRFAGDTTLEMLEEIASNSIGEDVSGYRTEFVDLIRQIRKLTTR